MMKQCVKLYNWKGKERKIGERLRLSSAPRLVCFQCILSYLAKYEMGGVKENYTMLIILYVRVRKLCACDEVIVLYFP